MDRGGRSRKRAKSRRNRAKHGSRRGRGSKNATHRQTHRPNTTSGRSKKRRKQASDFFSQFEKSGLDKNSKNGEEFDYFGGNSAENDSANGSFEVDGERYQEKDYYRNNASYNKNDNYGPGSKFFKDSNWSESGDFLSDRASDSSSTDLDGERYEDLIQSHGTMKEHQRRREKLYGVR